jgi:UDP-N-acetylmuramate dehydrogenase
MSDLAARLAAHLRGRVAEGVPLAPLTTYRLGGPAALLVEPADEDDLVVLAAELGGADVPLLPLGRGSNVVFSDAGFDGVVVRFGTSFQVLDDLGGGTVVAGAGVSLPVLANFSARRGLSGVEFGVGVPGSVGGAVRMNAGAHGREICDSLVSVRLVRAGAAGPEEVPAADLGLAYRRSALTERDWVVAARFELEPADPARVQALVSAHRARRAATQPPPVANAGSTFKNPPGDHAGRLIEAAGLKGFAVGGARVSELHANFFVAEPGARAQDVYDLVRAVKARVAERFGIELEPEVSFVGDFAGEGA